MRGRFAIALVVLGVACAEPTTNPIAGPVVSVQNAPATLVRASGPKIDGSYIVVLREDGGDRKARVKAKVAKVRRGAKHEYTEVLSGFAADLSDDEVTVLLADPDVAYIEEDQPMYADATQTGATWGIDRTDQRNLPLSGSYTYTTTASGVYAYIIDTGILTSHSQFGGRATNVYDAFGGNGSDCHGHGTHVAGTVGGSTYGIAKAVRLRGLRVLDCNGSGSTSGIIAAVDWLRVNRTNPAVANMSLGGGVSTALNTAVNSLASSGVFVAVAAGNENTNACNRSPASAANATVVAATTSTDTRASYSNYGSCVDLYAPGSSITSAWNNGGTNTISGTSMATPHVAGVAALYKATYGNASYTTIRSWLTTNATGSKVKSNPSGTPNLLLYKGTL